MDANHPNNQKPDSEACTSIADGACPDLDGSGSLNRLFKTDVQIHGSVSKSSDQTVHTESVSQPGPTIERRTAEEFRTRHSPQNDHQIPADLSDCSNYFYLTNSTCTVQPGPVPASPLQNILESTKLLMKHDDPTKHVSTFAERSALKLLKRFGCVFIKGIAGTGKSRVGVKLLSEIAKNTKSKPVIISLPQNWDLLPKTGTQYVALIDDIFGSSNLVQSQVDEWTRLFDVMWPSVESGQILLVITSRPEISAQCENKVKKYKLMKKIPSVTLDEGQFSLREEEKKSMLRKYRIDKTLLSEGSIKKIARTNTVLGFPQSCEFFASSKLAQAMGAKFFQKPHECLSDVIQCMKENDPLGHFVLVLLMMNKCSLEHKQLKPFQSSSEFNNLVTELSKGFQLHLPPSLGEIKKKAESFTRAYLLDTKTGYRFAHQSVFDAVFLCMAVENPEIAIKVCPPEMLVEFVRTEESKTEDEDVVIKLTQDKYGVLIERITELLVTDKDTSILNHPSLGEDIFAKCIVEQWEGNTNQHIVKHIIEETMSKQVDVVSQKNGRESYVLFTLDNQLAYLVWKNQTVARHIINSETAQTTALSPQVLTCAVHSDQYDLALSLLDHGLTADEDCVRALCASKNMDQNVTNRILCNLSIEWEYVRDGKDMLSLAAVNGNRSAVDHLLKSIKVNRERVVLECFQMFCEELKYNGRYKNRELTKIELVETEHILSMFLGCIPDRIKDKRDKSLMEVCAGHAYSVALVLLFKRGLQITSEEVLYSLHAALKYGGCDCVQKLLDQGPEKEAVSSKIADYLCDAASSQLDSGAKLELLLRYISAVDKSHIENCVNGINSEGKTPLIVAAKHGNTESLKTLITMGADVNGKGNWDFTPLSMAVHKKHLNCVKMLLESGVRFHHIDSTLYTYDIDIMKCLLTEGHPVYCSIWYAWFMEAAESNDIEMLDILQSGCLMHRIPSNTNEFFIGVLMGDFGVLKHLAVTCERLVMSIGNGSALHYAAMSNIETMEKIHYLIEVLNVPVEVKDFCGRSALFPAVQSGDLEVVEYLMEKGLDLKDRDVHGYTLLHAVCDSSKMSFAVVKFLVDAGVNAGTCGSEKGTALHVALQNKHVRQQQALSLLIEKTTNINQLDSRKRTPLDLAVKYGRTQCVELLIHRGAKQHLS